MLPDKFTPPTGGRWGENTPEKTAIYMPRCFPSIPEIVKKVMGVKAERKAAGAQPLRKVYVMTNGARGWLTELKEALWNAGGKGEWDAIATSRDLELDWEQKFVSQALDMYVAQRAQTFIGNGVSSPSTTRYCFLFTCRL